MRLLGFACLQAFFLFTLGVSILVFIAGFTGVSSDWPPETTMIFFVLPVNALILAIVYLLRKLKNFHGIYGALRESVTAYGLILLPFILAMIVLNTLVPLAANVDWYYPTCMVLSYVIVWFFYLMSRRWQMPWFFSIVTSITIIICCIGLAMFLMVALDELTPHIYADFPLDDPKGRYVLNYDGDYWLTYYTKNTDGEWEKNGNTAITQTPVDLKSYLEVPVRVTGSFVPTLGPMSGSEKRICIRNSCEQSKGPGVWHASPLRLTSIEQE